MLVSTIYICSKKIVCRLNLGGLHIWCPQKFGIFWPPPPLYLPNLHCLYVNLGYLAPLPHLCKRHIWKPPYHGGPPVQSLRVEYVGKANRRGQRTRRRFGKANTGKCAFHSLAHFKGTKIYTKLGQIRRIWTGKGRMISLTLLSTRL